MSDGSIFAPRRAPDEFRSPFLFQVFAAVELTVDVTEAFVSDVGVDLGGDDVFVTKEFLNGAEIDSLFK